jgi:hypothetical protein
MKKTDQDWLSRQKSWWENNYFLSKSSLNNNDWKRITTDIWVINNKGRQIFIFGKQADLQELLTTKVNLNSDGWIVLSKGIFPVLDELQIKKFLPPQKWIVFTGKRVPRKLLKIAKNLQIPLISSRKTFGLSLNFSQGNWQLKTHHKK